MKFECKKLALFCVISMAILSCKSVFANNELRFSTSSKVGTPLGGDVGATKPDGSTFESWVDFFHEYDLHTGLTLDSQLNNQLISLGGLNLLNSNIPNIDYPASNVLGIDLSNNRFSNLNFLYGVSNSSGPVDISGNSGLKDLGYIAHLQLPSSGSYVAFDPAAQYISKLDSGSDLCISMLSGNVGVKTLEGGLLVAGDANDYCGLKDAWISAYHSAGIYMSLINDSQLKRVFVNLYNSNWGDSDIPNYDYPVSEVSNINIRYTDLTNIDFMMSVKKSYYDGQSFNFSYNKFLKNLDGLKNLRGTPQMRAGYTYYPNSVVISNNDELESLSGAQSALGTLSARNQSSSLLITNNPKLTDIPKFPGFGGSYIDLKGNTSLKDFSFLANTYFYEWDSGYYGRIELDAANVEIKPKAEAGPFCGKLFSGKLRVNNSSGLNSVRTYCELAPWPSFFTNELSIQIYDGTTSYWAITNDQLTNRTLNFSNKNVTGKIPTEPYPAYQVRNIGLSNVTGLVDVSFLSTITSLVGSGGVQISSNKNLVSLNGLQNLTALNYVEGGSQNTLYVQSNIALTDISALSNLTTPNSINITGNTALKSLVGLENVMSVKSTFNLSGNAIEDLTPLANLINNYEPTSSMFNLSSNKISNISALAGSQSARLNIDLSNNQLTSLEGLRGRTIYSSTGQVALNISGNPSLNDLSPLSEMPVGKGTINIGDYAQYTTFLDRNGPLCQRALAGDTSINIQYKSGGNSYYALGTGMGAFCK